MLVIKRKVSEAILIGDNIEIIVSEISNDKVNLCINAPKEVKISRKELLETYEFNESAVKAINSEKYRNLQHMFEEDKNHMDNQ